MKNLLFIVICGMTVFFMTNCMTAPANTEPEILMISHSLNYQYYSQQGDVRQRKDDRPEWFPPKFNDWKTEKEKSDNDNLYFLWPPYPLDENSPVLKQKIEELKKQNKEIWSLPESYNEVYKTIQVEVASQIGVRIENLVRDEQTGTVRIDDNNVRSQGQESLFSITESEANAYFEGLREFKSFFAEFEEGRKINVAQYWLLFTIPKASVEKARGQIEEDRRAAQDAEIARKNNETREENLFSQKAQEHERIIRELDNLTFIGDEIQYASRYSELLHINATLATLQTLKNRDDDIGKKYEALVGKIVQETHTYNPAGGQTRLIENLRMQVANLTGQASVNKLVSQQFIIPFPQRPYEIKIPALNIFAADDMISNREFISFASTDGINSYSRGGQGLDTTVVSVSWNDAVRYCNFLSNFYGYTPCYTEVNRQITGYDKSKNGFRLPEFDEIAAILATQPGLINEEEFHEIGIWSSDGGPSEYTVYILSHNSGPANERLMSQSVKNTMSDPYIGFRIVRNAE
jgi:hypothetical protein